MTTDDNTDTALLERQKFLASRLYQKIDYHKTNRVRLPVVVAATNFGLYSVSEDAASEWPHGAVILMIPVVTAVGLGALFWIRFFFNRNVDHLEHLYDKMKMKTNAFTPTPNKPIAERARAFWYWLMGLVLLAGLIPLLFAAKAA